MKVPILIYYSTLGLDFILNLLHLQYLSRSLKELMHQTKRTQTPFIHELFD